MRFPMVHRLIMRNLVMSADNVWVIIPAYNEAKRIIPVIEKTKDFVSNIVVVDDGSSDNTAQVAKDVTPNVLRHVVNLGKGAALKTGVVFALRRGAKKIVMLDADGQHLPQEIPLFLRKLEEVDFVFGVRKFTSDMPVILRIGNGIISWLTYILHGIKLQDTQCGFRAFNAEVFSRIEWKSTDYGVESEMIANVGRGNLRYTQVVVSTIYLDKFKGTTVLDGAKIVGQMLWRKVRR